MMLVPTVIDVEASGFGAGSYPLEIGIALPDATARCYLIRPEPEWTHWDLAAERVHRITRDVILSHGLPARTVARTLNDLLGGSVVYSDSWGYDQTWLALLFDAAECAQSFRVESLRALLTESQLLHWQAARSESLEALGHGRHRASVDAAIIQRSFLQAARLSENSAAETPSNS